MTDQPPTEPGAELNAWLARALDLKHSTTEYLTEIKRPNGQWVRLIDWHPSTDPGLAVTEIIPAMNGRGWRLHTTDLGDQKIGAWFTNPAFPPQRIRFWKNPDIGQAFAGAMALAAAAALAAEKGVSDATSSVRPTS